MIDFSKYSDLSEDSQFIEGSSYGKFGLNKDAKLSKVAYENLSVSNTDKALKMEFSVGDKTYYKTFFNPMKSTQGFRYKGKVYTDPSSEGYIKGQEQNVIRFMSNLVHVLKAFVPEEVIQTNLKGLTTFQEVSEVSVAMLTDKVNKNLVDIFLEYQYSIKKGNSRTFLQIPENLYSGRYIVSSQKGTFTPVDNWNEVLDNGTVVNKKGLAYINNEGDIHPLHRNAEYMLSNSAKEQKIESTPNVLNSNAKADSLLM